MEFLNNLKTSLINNEKFYFHHLSHIDLDWYGSQYIMKKIFDFYKFKNYICYNSNYWNDLSENIWKINKSINLINENEKSYEKHYLLITDLNLLETNIQSINNMIKKRRGKLEVLLLDHHIVSDELIKDVEWYKLNKDFCATKLVWIEFIDFMINKENQLNKTLNKFSDFVNVSDLWLKGDKDFTKSNYLSDLIYTETKFFPRVEEFETISRGYKFSLMEKVFSYFLEWNSIEFIEKNLFNIMKEILLENNISDEIYNDENLSIRHKYYKLFYKVVKETNKDVFKTADNLLYKIFYWYGDSETYLANYYLEEKDNNLVDYVDFILILNSNWKMSFRSTKNINVQEIAKKYFNWGGHLNASGWYYDLWIIKDKENIINTITNILAS